MATCTRDNIISEIMYVMELLLDIKDPNFVLDQHP